MKTETTKTEVNIITITQRLPMLTSAPAAPVKGRGAVRHCISGDPEVIDYMIEKSSPHFACVSVREAVNCFGRLGTPKYLFCSPEMMALFN